MHTILYAVIGFFVAANVAVEYRNRRLFPPFRDDLSEYLADVPWFWLQDAGYFALAFALPAIGFTLGGLWVEILFSVACVALVFVVLTKLVIHYGGVGPFVAGEMETAHLVSAGVAFGAITVALLIHSWLRPNITFVASLLAPLSAAAFNRLAPQRTAIEEKTYTLCLLIAILAAL